MVNFINVYSSTFENYFRVPYGFNRSFNTFASLCKSLSLLHHAGDVPMGPSLEALIGQVLAKVFYMYDSV